MSIVTRVSRRLPVWRVAALPWWVCLPLLLTLLGSGPPHQGSRPPGAWAASSLPRPASGVLAGGARLLSAYGHLPLSFELNEGQLDRQVAFVARTTGGTVFLSATDASLLLALPPGVLSARSASGTRTTAIATPQAGGPQVALLHIRLEGATAHPVIRGLDRLPGVAASFVGSDPRRWHTGAPTFARVAYRQVYAGIDLLYHGAQGHLEYDFVIAPGGNPHVIRLRLTGAHGLRLDQQGNLICTIAGAEVRQERAVITQIVGGQRRVVAGGYVVLGPRQIGFAVGAYDHHLPLTIDPLLVYSTYLGGRGDDAGQGIAVDRTGNAYIAGVTSSPDFPLAHPLRHTPSGVFVAKLNASGSALLYSTYLGGSAMTSVAGIAVDSGGNAYVTGTAGPGFPTTAHALLRGFQGTEKVFVTKLNPSGRALVYSTYLGGEGDDGAGGIAVDGLGDAYVTGQTSSQRFPLVHAVQTTNHGDRYDTGGGDAFVAKLNASGRALVYSTYLGGSGFDSGAGIAVDSRGSAYVTGDTGSSDFPTTVHALARALNRGASSDGALRASFDVFVVRLSPGGQHLIYSTYLGGSEDDSGRSIALDTAGDVYLTGSTFSPNFPISAHAPLAFSDVLSGAFAVKLNATGSRLLYATYLGGHVSGTIGYGVAVDTVGNAYITGATGDWDFPTTHALQARFRSHSRSSSFVVKLSATGSTLLYSTFFGGNGAGRGIAVDGAGDVYITGSNGYTGVGSLPLAHALQPIYGGGGNGDAFVAKISDGATPQPSSTPSAPATATLTPPPAATAPPSPAPPATPTITAEPAAPPTTAISPAVTTTPLSGTLLAWGLNESGELGNGTTTDLPSPVPVGGLHDVVALAAGAAHSLALTRDGTVWTWGFNGDGELGNGATTNQRRPVPVGGLHDVVALAAGGQHSLALQRDGTVWAWGGNHMDQLGTGTTINQTRPVQVRGFHDVIALAAGAYHSLALQRDGTVWAWGLNGNGQLGNGTATYDQARPVQVRGLHDVIALAAGSAHSLALQRDGTVWAWGLNGNGQLGNGTATEQGRPVQVRGLHGVSALAAGQVYSLALQRDGTVWAWGTNGNAEPLFGTFGDVHDRPAQVHGLQGVVALSAGNHSLALERDGMVWTWGLIPSADGEPGHYQPNPVRVRGLRGVISIAAGSQHNLALSVQPPNAPPTTPPLLPTATETPHPAPTDTPVPPAATEPATPLSGAPLAWGANSSGELGNGATTDRTSPAPVRTIHDVTALTAGYRHTLALERDGTVWAWGANGSGQLGTGTTGEQHTPVRVSSLTDVIALTAGAFDSLALTRDGTVWAWGANGSGQLGLGDTTTQSRPVPVPGLTGVIALAAGYQHSLALRKDGTVWAWGDNGLGALGLGTTTTVQTSPVQVPGLRDVIALAANGYHSLALERDGTVWAWGYTGDGRILNPSAVHHTGPVQIPGLHSVIALAPGGFHSLALERDGTVWAWGDNSWGALGLGTTTTVQTSPVQVPGLGDVIALAAGAYDSLAVVRLSPTATATPTPPLSGPPVSPVLPTATALPRS